eukprot:tig00021571_g22366.t1
MLTAGGDSFLCAVARLLAAAHDPRAAAAGARAAPAGAGPAPALRGAPSALWSYPEFVARHSFASLPLSERGASLALAGLPSPSEAPAGGPPVCVRFEGAFDSLPFAAARAEGRSPCTC